MNLLKEGKTNWKYILIVVILSIVVVGLVLIYHPAKFQPIRPPKVEKKVTITTDKTEYEEGENIKITIENGLDKSIWYQYPLSPYDRNLELLGYNEKTNWSLVPLLPSIPPPPGGYTLEIKELRKNELLTLEYRPLDWHHPVALNFIKYKLSFEYRENKEEGEYKTIYSNEFTTTEKDETADCLKKYPAVVFEDCIPGEVVDGWWGTILYPNTLDTSNIEHHIDAPAPEIVKQAGIASYGASRSTCQTTWFIKIDEEWKRVSQIEFCNYIIDYNSSCNDCLLEWEEGCC